MNNALKHSIECLAIVLLTTVCMPIMANKPDSLLWTGLRSAASAIKDGRERDVMPRIMELLERADSLHELPAMTCLYMLMGSCYEESGQQDKALEAYRQGTTLCEQGTWLRKTTEAGHEEWLRTCISMYLQSYLIYSKRGAKQLAKEAAHNAIPWINMSRDPEVRATSTLAIGELLTSEGDKKVAKNMLTQAYYDAKALGRKDMIVTAATHLLSIGVREELMKDNTLKDSILYLAKEDSTEDRRDSIVPFHQNASPNTTAAKGNNPPQTRTVIQDHWEEAAIAVCAIALFTIIYVLRQRRIRRKQVARSFIDGREEERKRLARELHDGVSNQLLAVQMQLNNNGSREQAMQLLSESREQVRRVSHELMPPEFTHSTLPEIIADYAESMNKSSTPEITCHVTLQNADWASLSAEQALEIYRIIQEAVTNAIKHSGATSIAIGLLKRDNNYSVVISDDGTANIKTDNEGIGIRTMRQRAEDIGAKLELFHGSYGHTVKLVLCEN